MGLANGVGLDRLVNTMQVDWYRTTTRPIAAACLAALLCSGCDSHSSASAAAASTPKESAAAVAPEPAAPKPSSPEPTAPQPESFTTTGPLVAEQQADISAERPGRIVEVAVQIGEHVQAGQLLARLDDRLLTSLRPRLRFATLRRNAKARAPICAAPTPCMKTTF
jgi:multidrug efflux pump subunit AcrA (membrane-fusion protein)